MTSRTRSDPGVVAIALVLVAACILVAGVLAYAGGLGAPEPCAEACACAAARQTVSGGPQAVRRLQDPSTRLPATRKASSA